ncbi:hypothetical protein K3495_g10351 [Podosphaera aphanis]|nr:hypothetical protein K3495_g10351 [Podosphaera aphanis]
MQRLDVLHSPMTIFSQIVPYKDETIKAFAWRMREAFYSLSGSDRESDTTRDLLKEIAMKRLPRVWTLAQPHSIGLTNYEIIEMIVQVATRVRKWPIEDQIYAQSDQAQLQQASIVDPRLAKAAIFDDIEPNRQSPGDEVFAINNDTCYNCGKKGHWAKDCRSNGQSNKTPESSNFFKDKGQKPYTKKFSDEVRKRFLAFKNKNNTNLRSNFQHPSKSKHRAFVVEPQETYSSDTIDRDAISKFEADNVDEEIENFLTEMLSDSSDE